MTRLRSDEDDIRSDGACLLQHPLHEGFISEQVASGDDEADRLVPTLDLPLLPENGNRPARLMAHSGFGGKKSDGRARGGAERQRRKDYQSPLKRGIALSDGSRSRQPPRKGKRTNA